VDVSEMQRKLSPWATDDPTKRFVDLYSLLCNDVWLRVAAHAVLKNQGSETAGIDGKTKANFLGGPCWIQQGPPRITQSQNF